MTTPDMHAALARLVNNEQTRKQEKIDQSLPKRSSREAELSPRGSAPRLVNGTIRSTMIPPSQRN